MKNDCLPYVWRTSRGRYYPTMFDILGYRLLFRAFGLIHAGNWAWNRAEWTGKGRRVFDFRSY